MSGVGVVAEEALMSCVRFGRMYIVIYVYGWRYELPLLCGVNMARWCTPDATLRGVMVQKRTGNGCWVMGRVGFGCWMPARMFLINYMCLYVAFRFKRRSHWGLSGWKVWRFWCTEKTGSPYRGWKERQMLGREQNVRMSLSSSSSLRWKLMEDEGNDGGEQWAKKHSMDIMERWCWYC